MTVPASSVMRQALERYANGGVDTVLELVATDAVFVVSPEASVEPDVYEGHDGCRRYFAGFEGIIDEVRFELLEVEDVSPETGIGELRLSGLGAVTRIPVEQSTYMTFSVRDGLITRIVAHGDLESARREL